MANAQAQSAPAVAGSDWPQPNFDYANTRAVTSSPISSSSVGQLGVGWTFGVNGTSAYGALASTPVVVNGTVYLQDLKSNVYAIDLRSGSIKWHKDYNADSVGPNGPAFDQGKLFVASNEQTVAALDANTGNELWSVHIAPPDTQGVDQQPVVFNGTVYVSTVPGPSFTNFYVAGGMGIIYALDEQTGSTKWSFNTVKDGDLWGNPGVNSGGGAWYPPAIDTATGVTYWGTGNPAPFPGTTDFPNGTSRPGPNLYTDSELALDSSGQLQWAQQIKPHDLSDADFQSSPILATLTSSAGAAQDVVIGSGKLGTVVSFDRHTGEQLWQTPVGTHQNDDLDSFPADRAVTVFPGFYGGVETPMAYADGTVYVPVVNLSADYTASSGPNNIDFTTATGELNAIDAATGNILWSASLNSADFGGAAVVGDLVFTSTYAGEVVAFDRSSGTQVWNWQAPAGINGFMAVAGDTLLIPVGLGSKPELVALRLGAGGQPAVAMPTQQPAAPTPQPVAPTSQPVAPTPQPLPPVAAPVQLSLSSPVAPALSFSPATLTAAAGAQVTLTYTNNSNVPHNWHLFNGADASAASIAATRIMTGPGAVDSVQFTAPAQAGSYFFWCDVHQNVMTGQLVVGGAP
jgi:glucose dehydrogenase/plastocyanin